MHRSIHTCKCLHAHIYCAIFNTLKIHIKLIPVKMYHRQSIYMSNRPKAIFVPLNSCVFPMAMQYFIPTPSPTSPKPRAAPKFCYSENSPGTWVSKMFLYPPTLPLAPTNVQIIGKI